MSLPELDCSDLALGAEPEPSKTYTDAKRLQGRVLMRARLGASADFKPDLD